MQKLHRTVKERSNETAAIFIGHYLFLSQEISSDFYIRHAVSSGDYFCTGSHSTSTAYNYLALLYKYLIT